ncbi:MAG: hypothetical protein COV74_09230 [Candidatus Omnitrophica bacterium CG11_big_fil_rev_8_21_14_0_20_45_26]|uniref:Glycosyltransferase subfamily 4-like N-terminal domain-containing protein n=1 Tax=Candidatus Abzuiibacterium crystallinum TaxID=1974748 RepID=A0A2H0LLV7_9BACT|nr:MAG: hypothetical protein COV74_09230 [Candidatus Omnitrophica bacterium CG11_big_fil_rev_8_21_14_0_20_45_26]PIW63253.1 MAG: hypothetical protein COW12_11205 [Candidatus Omnitrophica bacterium CG12_big_fil_rev_8_21_14_0_65_45_16]
MRIGLVNEFYPPFAPGGAEWSMYELAKGLRTKGHDVVIITPNYGTKSFEENESGRIYRYAFVKRMKEGRRLPGFIWLANPIHYVMSAIFMIKIIRKEQLELIHVQNKYTLVGAWIAARLTGIPILASIRDTSHICRIAVCLHHFESVPQDCGIGKLLEECSEEYYEQYYPVKSLRAHLRDKVFQVYHWMDVHLRRIALNRVDTVIGVSQGILNVHEKSRVFTNSRQAKYAIYNFVDVNDNADSLDKTKLADQYQLRGMRIVLYVGGFSKGKGTQDFIDVARRFENRTDNTLFVMIGSGKSFQLPSNVKLIRDLDHYQTLQMYQLAHVVVVPSVCQESLSRVVLEAMSAGKPIVGTRVGGTPEAVLDGENGFVVERGDVEALSEAITKLVVNDALREKMGERSKELVRERFNQELQIEKIEALYQTCLGE